MYFSIGSHEAYSVEGNISDYRLDFEKAEPLVNHLLDGPLLNGKTEPKETENGALSMDDEEFKALDTLIFVNTESKKVTFRGVNTAKSVSVEFPGTDNLLIATVGVALVGIYSNYLLLIQTVQTILNQVINAVTASVGNLVAKGSDRQSEVYRNIIFAVAWLYGFSAVALDTLMGRFILIAFGDTSVLAMGAVHIMAVNFLLAGIRQPNMMFINAAGLFKAVRWRGFVEAAVNLTVSALFLWFGMGLFGVLLRPVA